jgi:tRNA A-37 threonylcarbamoyl transferase component Bud32
VQPTGSPIAAGRNADVYAVDERTVLRRYRAGGDTRQEADVMAHLRRLGYPVPDVFAADGPDLVLERVPGPTMLEALLGGGQPLADGARMLADLHRRLHDLPALVGGAADDRILHLDLHPDNVILAERGPVVIDWRDTDEGVAGLDVAMTAVILAQAGVSAEDGVAAAARAFLHEFLLAVGSEALCGQLPCALQRRSHNPALTSDERALLPAAAALVTGGNSPG